jgi:hypothetical protein
MSSGLRTPGPPERWSTCVQIIGSSGTAASDCREPGAAIRRILPLPNVEEPRREVDAISPQSQRLEKTRDLPVRFVQPKYASSVRRL